MTGLDISLEAPRKFSFHSRNEKSVETDNYQLATKNVSAIVPAETTYD